jgi:peptide/nickel transport system permease protein
VNRRGWLPLVGGAIVIGYLLAALLAPWIAPAGPGELNVADALAVPSAAHPLGTDDLGRDALSRLLYAGRVDLVLGAAAAVAACVLGTLAGLVSGYAGGWLDLALTRVMDIAQTMPAIVTIMVLLLVLGRGPAGIVVALALAGWVGYARLARGTVLAARSLDYVAAARLAGLAHGRILFRHVLPNVWTQGFVFLASDVVLSVGAIAALGYLGIGLEVSAPEWGQMISAGQAFLATNWWLSLAPGLAIVVLGLGLALVSDGLTDGLTDGLGR